MTVENDQRHFHRIIYKADASLTDNEIKKDCQIIDLCLKGCLLEFPTPWEDNLESIYTLNLKLAPNTEIKMELEVAHVIANTVGFKCVHIDIDSISQLRRLVELNLGDSTLLERDLLALSEGL